MCVLCAVACPVCVLGRQVLLQVAHSLLHLHKHGVIHSDVKCENVLLMTSSSSPVGFICKLGGSCGQRLIYVGQLTSEGRTWV